MIEFGVDRQKFAEDTGGTSVRQASAEFCLKKLQFWGGTLRKQRC
jgi:hypothetical protein